MHSASTAAPSRRIAPHKSRLALRAAQQSVCTRRAVQQLQPLDGCIELTRAATWRALRCIVRLSWD